MGRLGRIIVRILASIGLIVVIGLGFAIWGAVTLHDRVEPPLPKRMVLNLDLEADFAQTTLDDPLARLAGDEVLVLRRVVDSIDRAAGDERVAGLFATMGEAKLGVAGAQEIRDAVTRFKASGKPAILFAETIGEFGNGTLEYYLASAFGQIWLQPSGDVGLTGFVAESPFLKGTLDLLGISTQFAARKEYKTAIENLTHTKYSPASAETLNALLDSWTEQTVRGIAEGRRMPVEKARALFGKGPFLASEALSAGLVDQLGYRDHAWAAAGGGEDVDLAEYAHALPKPGGTKVALITGEGPIMRGDARGAFGRDEGFGATRIAEAFRDAIDDPAIKAILFRVDSPGGSYVASDTLWNEVRRARDAGKKVVVSMGDAAASGGYFVAMGADRIVAQPGTITGSIGVFSGKLVMQDFWAKLGISWDEIHRGDNAAMWSFNRPFSDPAWERVNVMLDRIYADFTAKAAEGRGMSRERMEEVARGRVWSGAEAERLGLVDALGGYDVAQAQLRELLGLAPDAGLELVALPEPEEPWKLLARMLGGGGNRESLAILASVAKVLEPLAAQVRLLEPQAGVLRAPHLPTASRP